MLTGITQGKAGVRRLAQRLVLWGVNLIWYLIAILLVSVSEMLVAAALGSRMPCVPCRQRHGCSIPSRTPRISSLVHAQREQAGYSPRAWERNGSGTSCATRAAGSTIAATTGRRLGLFALAWGEC